MTNKEILQTDLLDILFEHRNKLYGAYALRKTYTHRLGIALGVALSSVLLCVFMSFINKHRNTDGPDKRDPNAMQLTAIDLSKPDDPTPPKPKPEIKPPKAEVDYQQFRIVEDDQADPDIVDITDIQNANIGDQNIERVKPDDLATTIVNQLAPEMLRKKSQMKLISLLFPVVMPVFREVQQPGCISCADFYNHLKILNPDKE